MSMVADTPVVSLQMLTACLLISCGPAGQRQAAEPGRSSDPAAVESALAAEGIDGPSASDVIRCAKLADLERAWGKKVSLEGRYEIVALHTKKGDLMAQWPAVVLGDGTKVLLESLWHHQGMRSSRERPEWVGKPVRTVGLLHPEPPKDEGAQNLAAPTLDPVDSIEPM